MLRIDVAKSSASCGRPRRAHSPPPPPSQSVGCSSAAFFSCRGFGELPASDSKWAGEEVRRKQRSERGSLPLKVLRSAATGASTAALSEEPRPGLFLHGRACKSETCKRRPLRLAQLPGDHSRPGARGFALGPLRGFAQEVAGGPKRLLHWLHLTSTPYDQARSRGHSRRRADLHGSFGTEYPTPSPCSLLCLERMCPSL